MCSEVTTVAKVPFWISYVSHCAVTEETTCTYKKTNQLSNLKNHNISSTKW